MGKKSNKKKIRRESFTPEQKRIAKKGFKLERMLRPTTAVWEWVGDSPTRGEYVRKKLNALR